MVNNDSLYVYNNGKTNNNIHTKMKRMIKFNLITLMVGITTMSFICSYFFDIAMNNAEQYMAVIMVIFADGFFGIWRGVKAGDFQTKLALKVPKTLAFWVAMLTIILIIEKGITGIGWISEAVLIPFIVFQLISVLKNASMLGLIPNSLLTTILAKLDKHKGI